MGRMISNVIPPSNQISSFQPTVIFTCCFLHKLKQLKLKITSEQTKPNVNAQNNVFVVKNPEDF